MKIKCFTKSTLEQANRIAVSRNYNRQLPEDMVAALPSDQWFPIMFTMIHEHAQGIPVDPHIRCWVVLDPSGRVFIDCDSALYRQLAEFDVDMPEKAGA